MTTVFLALGSNVKPRIFYLKKAIERLKTIGKIKEIAPLYCSEAYGFKNQTDFYNSACIIETNLLPLDLLNSIKLFEKEIGRKQRFQWGPREIDIDIIFYGENIIKNHKITIPHSDYKNRRFVLRPLIDMDSKFIPPDAQKPLKELIKDCPDKTLIKQIMTDWID